MHTERQVEGNGDAPRRSRRAGRAAQRTSVAVSLALAVTVATGCGVDVGQSPADPPPSADQVEALYDYSGSMSVEMSGNVAQVTVEIDRDEYRMGGRVWAMASPYIFIFSPATERAFTEFSGLGGVRVIVRYPDGSMLAQALLERSELTSITWREALNVAAQARSQGTERPGFMRDLVRYGEEHTTFEYNPDHIEIPGA